ncbi:hypothetical protein JTE90_025777 [Oedothorax gibbosus]|uniref:Uncharacterized protein n=1 Tax=Oedothorax gibbosus TaxID=931172 RepID=A0AAV6TI65_9ARAC|nr:hypothetical protein JTE90_025777 [Oedothorax gibbosus]
MYDFVAVAEFLFLQGVLVPFRVIFTSTRNPDKTILLEADTDTLQMTYADVRKNLQMSPHLFTQQRPTTHHLTFHVKHLSFYLGGKFTQDYLKEAWHEPRIVCLDSATHNLLLGLMPNVTLLDGQLRQNNSLDLSLRAARLLNTKLGLEPYWDE